MTLLLVALAACVHRDPQAEDWFRAGFRTPLQTFDTFQNAVADDVPRIEFLCFAPGFSTLSYLEARDALRASVPFVRKVADAVVIEERRIGPDRCVLVAEIRHTFGAKQLEFTLVRQGFYEVWAADQDADAPWEDDFVDLSAALERAESARGGTQLRGGVPFPEDVELGELTELRLGAEWKIAGVRELPASDV
jgi:hypothetical protein